jgi:hypothetical protein
MTRHMRKIAVWCLASGIVVAVGSGAALLAKERESAAEYRSRAAQTLQQQMAATQAAEDASQKMTQAEQEQNLGPMRAKAQQDSNAMIQAAVRAEAEQPPAEACPVRGIIDPLTPDVIRPFHDWEFIVSDYWGGIVKGACLAVYGGYDPANPLQGELVIWNLTEGGEWQYYPTPTATGPIKIMADAKGELTGVSLKGTFYTNPDAGSQVGVETPGNATYVFDLETRKYR